MEEAKKQKLKRNLRNAAIVAGGVATEAALLHGVLTHDWSEHNAKYEKRQAALRADQEAWEEEMRQMFTDKDGNTATFIFDDKEM